MMMMKNVTDNEGAVKLQITVTMPLNRGEMSGTGDVFACETRQRKMTRHLKFMHKEEEDDVCLQMNGFVERKTHFTLSFVERTRGQLQEDAKYWLFFQEVLKNCIYACH